MKIYTKKGDAGQTSLLGGTRVSKSHIRIEAYGTDDELNSYIGLIRDGQQDDHLNDALIKIQNCLFTVGSILASDPEKVKAKIPDLEETDVAFLESEMDRMNEGLPDLKNFILPGEILYRHTAILHEQPVEERKESQLLYLKAATLTQLQSYISIGFPITFLCFPEKYWRILVALKFPGRRGNNFFVYKVCY